MLMGRLTATAAATVSAVGSGMTGEPGVASAVEHKEDGQGTSGDAQPAWQVDEPATPVSDAGTGKAQQRDRRPAEQIQTHTTK
jgi:hypothetical protein